MDYCIICGSSEYSVLFPANKAQKQRIVKCNQCKFIFANPQSTEEISGKISYDDMSPDRKKTIEKEDIERRYNEWLIEGENYLIKQHVQMKDYQKVLNFLEKRVGKGTLLDIGAYAGVFLHHAQKQGWKVTGIEPMEEAAEYSRREFGIEMIEEPLELIDFKEKFDAKTIMRNTLYYRF